MKRIFLFIVTNLAVMLTLSITAHLLGLNQFITKNGINFTTLLGFAAIFGFGGAIISLMLSKTIAKFTMGLKPIQGNENSQYAWIYSTIERQSHQAGISMPEVCIYDSPEMNAFATGPSKSNSLVAVSTGLLNGMRKNEVEAVLGHEVAHIANGDMVTMTLIQGVLNTFVIFISRIIGYFANQFFKGDEEESSSPSWIYMAVSIVLEIMFGILASIVVAAHSRRREFVADEGGAKLASKEGMIGALQTLSRQGDVELAGGLKAFGISGKQSKFFALFSTHPPLEDRIEKLLNQK